MSFIKMLTPDIENTGATKKTIVIESENANDVLRSAGIKIKSVFDTKFGTEFVLAKSYSEDDIKSILKNFKVKIDKDSIFVEK